MAQLKQSKPADGAPASKCKSLERRDSFTQVYDLADEEVHFSRYAADYYHYQPQPRVTGAGSTPGTSRPQTPTSSRPARRTSEHATPASSVIGGQPSRWPTRPAAGVRHDSQSIELSQWGLAAAPGQPAGTVDELERASSNRLLNSLGNKLRRGSNYLNAPAKLLGQYLLGITIQSWSEFFNTSRMTRAPTCATRHQLSRRLAANLSYFQGNYLCVSLVLVIYCILTSPLLLLAISAYLLALYLVTARSALGKQTRLLNYRLNLQQQYSFITLLALAPLWIAGAPSAIFWVIGASFFVIGLHASVYAIEQLAAEQHQHQHNLQALSGGGGGTHSLARLSQSLAVHTPTHQLSRQGYVQIDSPACRPGQQQSPPDSMRYYNHYPGVSRVSTARASSSSLESADGLGYSRLATAAPGSPPAAAAVACAASNYMPSAFTQWTFFGGSRQAPSKGGPAGGSKKVPDVKIISRDYAGLGRVYEV